MKAIEINVSFIILFLHCPSNPPLKQFWTMFIIGNIVESTSKDI
ncbi:MAG TPA: hypothetical protein PL168_03250 [Methanobacterium sp.]|nr:hypothetical protein [Methanobacterium sp.]